MRFWHKHVDDRSKDIDSRVDLVERQNKKAHSEFDRAKRNLERLIGDLKGREHDIRS